jgi:hydroxyethylthiazole kinase
MNKLGMLKECFENTKNKGVLVHNITNYVTVNDCANMILASGASPIMADDIDEVEEITSICTGLNINIGTLNKRTIASMFLAGKKANELHHPILLDPVGVGASRLRTKTAKDLVDQVQFSVIRGNISELKALANYASQTNGVDASEIDQITVENLDESILMIHEIALKLKTIVVVTGVIDIISDGKRACVICNGNKMMARVTGTGCMLSALMTAFISSNQEYMFEAAVTATLTMGIAGELAYEKIEKEKIGNASYRNYIIDQVYNLDSEILNNKAKVTWYGK